MRRPADTLHGFFNAFLALDARRMAQHYAPDARFSDPIFEVEGRERIGALWQILCDGAIANGRADWRLLLGEVDVQGDRGRAYWEPKYRYGAAHRRVHNRVESVFRFDAQGLIREQRDDFDLWRWSRQALGLRGTLLGWMPWFRTQLRRQASLHLDAWLADPPPPL